MSGNQIDYIPEVLDNNMLVEAIPDPMPSAPTKILMPDNKKRETKYCQVKFVGPGRLLEDGVHRFLMPLKSNDIILLEEGQGVPITFGDRKLLLIDYNMILLILRAKESSNA